MGIKGFRWSRDDTRDGSHSTFCASESAFTILKSLLALCESPEASTKTLGSEAYVHLFMLSSAWGCRRHRLLSGSHP